jgi:hypothetical protein
MLSHLLLSAVLIAASGSELMGVEPAHPKQLRAGAAASNITPRLGVSINGYFNERKAKGIHDELNARCLALDNGETRLAFVVCDSCMIGRETTDAIKSRIQNRTGLAADHILISATHSHTAPASVGLFMSEADLAYVDFMIGRIADGVERAIHNLTPAKFAWESIDEPELVSNRRWRLRPGTMPANPFGKTNDLVKMNPIPESPDLVEPAGPVDPQVSFVLLKTLDNRPIALLGNYSLHYVGTESDLEVSSDYYGEFCDLVRERLAPERSDPPFVALMSNGTSGDINNTSFRKKRPPQAPYAQVRIVAKTLADHVADACDNLEYHNWLPLNVRQKEIHVGVRHPDASDLARSEAILRATGSRPLANSAEVYAREGVLLDRYPSTVPVLLQAIKIGDLRIAAIPCEVFAEIGLEIKKRLRPKPAFTIELANGYNGYLPTPEQHKLGGYETWRARSSYLEAGASPKIVSALMALFADLE